MTVNDQSIRTEPLLTEKDDPYPNLPLLTRVLAHIDAHPEEWNQEQWGVRTACGTAMCLAGHVAMMTGAEPLWGPSYIPAADETEQDGEIPLTFVSVRTLDGRLVHVQDYARRELGLTMDEASCVSGLFAVGNSRADVQWHAESIAARGGERL